jgi:phospholipid transport system substrate-binding protein
MERRMNVGRAGARWLLATVWAATVSFALAQAPAPDALIERITSEVLAAVRSDRDIRAGDAAKTAALVEREILPHFDFRRATRIAVGLNWRRATAQQKERLVQAFRSLLVRTYAGAIADARDERIEFVPLRLRAGDDEATVRTRVRQPGAEPIEIAYDMEHTASGWKVYDVRVGGISLVATYRTSFAAEVRANGIEGLILRIEGKTGAATKHVSVRS